MLNCALLVDQFESRAAFAEIHFRNPPCICPSPSRKEPKRSPKTLKKKTRKREMRRDECRRCKDRMARFFVLRSSLFSSHLGQSQVVKTVNHYLYHVNQPPKCHCWLSLSGGFVVTDQHFQYSIYPDHCNDASGGRSFDSVAVILRRRATRKRQFRRVRLKRKGDYSQSL